VAVVNEGAKNIGQDAIDSLDLSRGLVMVGGAENKRSTESLVQRRPEVASEARVAVGDQHVGQTDVTEHRVNEVGRGASSRDRLDRGDEPDAPGEEVNVDLEEIVAGGRGGKLNEIQTDGATAAMRNRQREEEACWRAMLGLDSLAGGAGLHEGGDVRR
jgi:hypothetical protein